MGLLRRIATILGHAAADEDVGKPGESVQRRPTEGFGVRFSVPAEKPSVRPVFVPCRLGEGGVQGFGWYSVRLRIDDEGDVADEFLDEVLPPMSFGEQEQAAYPRFEVKYTTRPAPVRKQAITIDGNVHHSMEYHGILLWV